MNKDNQPPLPGENSGLDPELGCTFEELAEVLQSLADSQQVISEATGNHRTALKAILEERGWHKGALAYIRAIDAMSQSKRADFLRTFEAMFDMMVMKKWRDEMHDMIPSDGPFDDDLAADSDDFDKAMAAQ